MQVPKDVPGKTAEHARGEESSPSSPAMGKPPHGVDIKRYWLMEVAVERVMGAGGDGKGGPLCKGQAGLTVPLSAGGGERQRLNGGCSSQRTKCRMSARR